MPKPKTNITRTYGPIHFEDLEPHRFEDLVRELIYDYKDWQSIEATGRSGSDDGFDIRAYEKAVATDEQPIDDTEEGDVPHPMEGNLWMIQGKREKEIGPTKIRSILADVDKTNPPYGYILAASANFSKKTYDVFREDLRKKGVMEFYLWGKAELEDMLHLPKNDRILFTFFGVSLVSRRRSRATEIRSTVAVKNKLFRVLGEGQNLYKPVLIRDLKDIHYPFKSEYPNFATKPRWKEYVAFAHYPHGLRVHSRRYFAYVDRDKKEWDFTDVVDLTNRQVEEEDERKEAVAKRELVEDVWKFFPRANQAHFHVDGFVRYSDVAIVDDKGDVLYPFPHIYVDFVGERGPFGWFFEGFQLGERRFFLSEDYKRIKVFPKSFKKSKLGKIYRDKSIVLDPKTLENLKKYEPVEALYESDGRYSYLKPRDVIAIADYGELADSYIQVTHVTTQRAKDYLEHIPDEFRARRHMQQQLQREIGDDEIVNIYEFTKVYKWQLEQGKE